MDPESLKTPDLCADARAIRRFLNVSRHSHEDNVRNRLGQVTCNQFIRELYTEWSRRDSLLGYCATVAGLRTAEDNRPTTDIAALSQHARDRVEFARTNTDPRLDAYAARDELSRSSNLEIWQWLHIELGVEDITRDTAKGDLVGRCGGIGAHKHDYDVAYGKFKRSQN